MILIDSKSGFFIGFWASNALAGQGRSSLEAADGWNAQRASADGCRSEGQVPGVADVHMAAQMNMWHIVHESTCVYIYILYI